MASSDRVRACRADPPTSPTQLLLQPALHAPPERCWSPPTTGDLRCSRTVLPSPVGLSIRSRSLLPRGRPCVFRSMQERPVRSGPQVIRRAHERAEQERITDRIDWPVLCPYRSGGGHRHAPQVGASSHSYRAPRLRDSRRTRRSTFSQARPQESSRARDRQTFFPHRSCALRGIDVSATNVRMRLVTSLTSNVECAASGRFAGPSSECGAAVVDGFVRGR